jgi:hypothetical protein
MQTPLNTHSLLLVARWHKTFNLSRLRIAASLALLFFIGSFSQAFAGASFGSNTVIIGGTNAAVNGRYYTNNPNVTATKGAFTSVTSLGTFDRGSGSLLLSAQAITTESGADDVQSVQLFYRVYVTGTAPASLPAYTALNLDVVSNVGNANNPTRTWTASVNPTNLLTATSGGSNSAGQPYTLDFYLQLRAFNNQNALTTLFDRNPTVPYRTRFAVLGTPAASWVGNTTDWFADDNWSPAGVPGRNTDVTIALQGDVARYPVISGTTGQVAEVRTLRLDKSLEPSSPARILTVNSGELQVYGDFQNPNNGLEQLGGVFTLAGTTQTFDGGEFTRFRVQGGGTKTLRNKLVVTNSLDFSGLGGILATRTDNDVFYSVDLRRPAFVTGENEASYVSGILRATSYEITRSNTPYTFGDIGIELTSSPTSSTDFGPTTVTRRTGLTYIGAGPTETSTSIRRSFTFSTLDRITSQVYTINFRYLDNELAGKSASTLGIYRSANGIAPFDNLNRASNNTGGKTVVSTTITGTLAATFTLGESTVVPLPVTLVSFTATPTAQGGALLRWATATETNNKGFGIERQLTSSDSWQSVGYLASGNNATGSTYEYLDKSLSNATSSRQAYYRLRQEDQDGKVSYSPVAVVSRSAVATSSELLLSPVPVTGSNISLTFAEAGQAGSEITITNTQGQRLFSQTTQASADAALSLPVERLAAGVYIVSVRVPGQAVRHARFVKL